MELESNYIIEKWIKSSKTKNVLTDITDLDKSMRQRHENITRHHCAYDEAMSLIHHHGQRALDTVSADYLKRFLKNYVLHDFFDSVAHINVDEFIHDLVHHMLNEESIEMIRIIAKKKFKAKFQQKMYMKSYLAIVHVLESANQ